jgi:hypothetical protein
MGFVVWGKTMLSFKVFWNHGCGVQSSITYEGFGLYSAQKEKSLRSFPGDVYLVVVSIEGGSEGWLVVQNEKINGFKALQHYFEHNHGYPIVNAQAFLIQPKNVVTGTLNDMAREW